MPKQYLEEFRRDVTAVARKHEVPLSQVAHDFGVSEEYLCRWMRQVDVEEGFRESLTLVEEAKMLEFRKRNKLSEQENYILRRSAAYLGKTILRK